MALELLDSADLDQRKREGLWTLNFGPQHPATHTPCGWFCSWMVKLSSMRNRTSVLHSGFEKLGESLDFNQYVTIVDRMNYISPMANEIAWHHAVEKLLGLELTPRCKYIRTIFAELMRIHEPPVVFRCMRIGSWWVTAFMYAFNEREKIYEICERASGQRFSYVVTRELVDCFYDVTDEWIQMVRDFREDLSQGVQRFRGLVMKDRIFVERTRRGRFVDSRASNRGQRDWTYCRASGVERDLKS